METGTMQEITFDPTNHTGFDTLSFTTDTATPQSVIPIFYIHPGDHPFCTKPGCLCMQHEKDLETLLLAVIRGELHIKQVSHKTMQ
jgi:hypothetical protein